MIRDTKYNACNISLYSKSRSIVLKQQVGSVFARKSVEIGKK